VPQVEWYRKAAEQGVPDAQTNPGELCANGDGIPRMTSKQLNGFAKLLNKEMPGLNSTWAVCTRLGEGFLVTRSRHTRGFP
jgi:TPR repeat protein